MDSSSFSGSSKRAKALGNLAQVANCLVDGCSADLSLCRDYHRRHKVCEAHSKTPRVTIAGREQRFCQQCSRFHSLVEFDEGKRSCRKRLDGHNRRRRKPLPESLPRATQRIVSFSNAPQMLGDSSVMSGYSWSGAVKPDQEMGVARNTHPHHHHQMNYIETAASSFPKRSDKSGYEAQLMQGSEVAIQEASIGQPPFLDAAAGSSSSSCFSQVVDSDGALSLLSSARLSNTLMDYHLPHQTKPAAHSTDAPTFHFPEMFPEGSSTGDSHQTLSFMWE